MEFNGSEWSLMVLISMEYNFMEFGALMAFHCVIGVCLYVMLGGTVV